MFYATDTGFTFECISNKQVPVTDEVWSELIQGQASGMVITTDHNGYPVLINAPQLTSSQAVANAQAMKSKLLSDAALVIAPFQDAVDLGMATDREVTLLAEWRNYRVLLNRVDTSTAPDITWPATPVA
ncbi:tail fiber assembly protein [Dickeya zeae]|uniref:tail fiber assembly protein n=1 Tax=Dickeya zeae TaxID=204042 RepID=UPI0003664140|nr:tail fiber assembly protein [Dickeya zeae]AJC68112.1 tail fiber protein [Dickeya zeae EC1]